MVLSVKCVRFVCYLSRMRNIKSFMSHFFWEDIRYLTEKTVVKVCTRGYGCGGDTVTLHRVANPKLILCEY